MACQRLLGSCRPSPAVLSVSRVPSLEQLQGALSMHKPSLTRLRLLSCSSDSTAQERQSCKQHLLHMCTVSCSAVRRIQQPSSLHPHCIRTMRAL